MEYTYQYGILLTEALPTLPEKQDDSSQGFLAGL